MFYCSDCANEYGYPETGYKSIVNCECCGSYKPCNEMQSSKLPKPKQPEKTKISDVTIDNMYKFYLEKVNLKEEDMHPTQNIETKQAFVAGISQMLLLFIDLSEQLTNDDACIVTTRLLEQIKEFWDEKRKG